MPSTCTTIMPGWSAELASMLVVLCCTQAPGYDPEEEAGFDAEALEAGGSIDGKGANAKEAAARGKVCLLPACIIPAKDCPCLLLHLLFTAPCA